MGTVRPGLKLLMRPFDWIGGALRDRSGVSAIEFAMIVPVLIGLYVGAVELGNALTINRRASMISSTAADLVAQTKEVTTADLQDVVGAASSLLTPYSTSPLTIVLTSVVADQNNSGKVDWSYANKGAARAKNSAYAVPAGLTQANSSVIVAEVSYAYSPLLNLTGFFSPGSFTMQRTFYARPRKSLTIKKTD